MAPTRPNKKKAKARDKAKRAALLARNQAGATNPKQLIAEAMAMMEEGDATSAVRLAEMACNDLGDNGVDASSALTLLGEIRIEMGEVDAARECFLKAVRATASGNDAQSNTDADLEAGGGAEKYLWLAQLSEKGGKDSVVWYERGATHLRTQIGRLEEAFEKTGQKKGRIADDRTEQDRVVAEACPRLGELKRRLAETLCAVVEVYMTDLSWEEDAEQRCDALVTEAGLIAPDHAETWQTLANVRISQSRNADARAALERSLALWSHLSPGDPAVPPFPTRIGLARLLIETGMEEAAADVVERLIQEDDESVEAWYLGGYGLYSLGQRQKDEDFRRAEEMKSEAVESTWKESWKSARRCLVQCLSHFETQDYEDERLGEHAKELLGLVVKEIGDIGAENDDDEWEDTDADQDEDEEMQ